MLIKVVRLWSRASFWLGFLLVLLYWYSVHPPEFSRGYVEDFGNFEISRQIIAEKLYNAGAPGHLDFTTDAFMTPMGASVPYMSWAIERDWLGGLVWSWNKDFPFPWAWFGVSLIATYLGVGYILGKMGLSRGARWSMSLLVVLFHVPRHFKIWHHYEHLLQHWVYLGFFLDAWLWQKFVRDREWSWQIELWRGVALLGVTWSAGVFWGPMILEWVLVHGALLWVGYGRYRRGERTRIQSFGTRSEFLRRTVPPLAILLVMLILDLRWFLPLSAEAKKLGLVPQNLAWFAHFGFVPRPLFVDTLIRMGWIPDFLAPLDRPETVITVGWSFWIPALAALWIVRKKRGGPGFVVVAPFAILLVTAVLYACMRQPLIFQHAIQAVVPFMSFFRVASRWGLLLPQILVILMVLAWPELTAAVRKGLEGMHRRRWIVGIGLFCLMGIAEASWMTFPVNRLPPLSKESVAILEQIRKEPGEAVLDLPFCVAGGNGVCTQEQCPHYPFSTLGQNLRQWHEKKVYGLYQSRMMPAHCEIYRKPPYTDWFEAWRANRCFNESDWKGFCGYLDQHREISAVLLYPEIWWAASNPVCLSEFEKHLGAPRGQSVVTLETPRSGRGDHMTRMIWFGARCLRKE